MLEHVPSGALARIAIAAVLLPIGVNCAERGGQPRSDAGSRRDAGMHAARDAAPRPAEDAGSGPAPPLADGAVGATCAADADCTNGRCMLSERITGTRFPDGYCTGPCANDAECGVQSLCAPGFRGAVGACYRRCENDADCWRDGYRCRVSSGVGACVPGPKPLPDDVVGNACSDDADCGGGKMTCATALTKVAAPLGYCSQSCALDADCGAGGTCISGVNGISLSLGTCYKSCVPPEACRDGYTCRSFSGLSDDPRGVCVPDRPDDDASVR